NPLGRVRCAFRKCAHECPQLHARENPQRRSWYPGSLGHCSLSFRESSSGRFESSPPMAASNSATWASTEGKAPSSLRRESSPSPVTPVSANTRRTVRSNCSTWENRTLHRASHSEFCLRLNGKARAPSSPSGKRPMIEDRIGSNRLRQRDIFVLRALVWWRTMTSRSAFSCGLSSLVLLASFHSARWRKAHASV